LGVKISDQPLLYLTMPVDLRQLVADIISKEEAEMKQKLNDVQAHNHKLKQQLNGRKAMIRYVEDVVEEDEALSKTFAKLVAADAIEDANKIEGQRQQSSPLLGLSVSNVLPSDEELNRFRDQVLPHVACRIEQDRDTILTHCNIGNIDHSTIGEAIASAKAAAVTSSNSLKNIQDQRDALLLEITKTIEHKVANLMLLLNETLPITLQEQVSSMRELASKLKCLNLKAQVVDTSLNNWIYSPSKIKALKVVCYELNKKMTAVDKEHSKWSAMANYFFDPAFNNLVTEYKEILDNINNQKFIIEQFKAKQTC